MLLGKERDCFYIFSSQTDWRKWIDYWIVFHGWMLNNTSNICQLNLLFCWKGLHELHEVIAEMLFKKYTDIDSWGKKKFSITISTDQIKSACFKSLCVRLQKAFLLFLFPSIFNTVANSSSFNRTNCQQIILEEHWNILKSSRI